jgi:predicted TIM-barrel fold metal-dependent hydrolase
MGIAPNDPVLEPYFALAEELDVPVAIHMGPGPPGAAYPSSPAPRKSPNYRASAGRPLLLEDVLLRHKRLRVWVMHGGWPLVDEMLFMLYQHPQVYIDVGVLQGATPRPEYYAYLKRLVDAGYGDRIMFGSDGGAAALRNGIDAIRQADFLTEGQKRAILYDNAARFLRLPPGPVSP